MVLLPSHTLRASSPPDESLQPPVLVVEHDAEASFVVGKRGIDLAAHLPDLTQGRSYLLTTRGGWSLHELILFVASRLGPCTARVASWGVSERPIRELLDARRDGRFTSLRFFLDVRVRSECPQAFQLLLAEPLAQVALAKNHSKLAVLQGADRSAVIISTANLTVNPRYEAFNVLMCTSTAHSLAAHLDLEMDGAMPFAAG